jgi:hypothetical protein
MSTTDISFHAQEASRSTNSNAFSITGFVKQNASIVPGMFVLVRLNSSVSLRVKITTVECIKHSNEGSLVRLTTIGDEEEIELLNALDIRDEVLLVAKDLE